MVRHGTHLDGEVDCAENGIGQIDHRASHLRLKSGRSLQNLFHLTDEFATHQQSSFPCATKDPPGGDLDSLDLIQDSLDRLIDPDFK